MQVEGPARRLPSPRHRVLLLRPDRLALTVEIVKRSDDTAGFVVLPKRWIVERTLAWLSRYRRLAKDYEETCESSETWIRIAMIHLMARRLATST